LNSKLCVSCTRGQLCSAKPGLAKSDMVLQYGSPPLHTHTGMHYANKCCLWEDGAALFFGIMQQLDERFGFSVTFW